MKTKTVKEILDYVVSHFKTNKRSVVRRDEDKQCSYAGGCAFAICCKEDSPFEEWDKGFLGSSEYSPYSITASLILRDCPTSPLKEEFEGCSKHFWNMVQNLHDHCDYWTDNDSGGQDLSDSGIQYYNTILSYYQ